MGICLPRRLNAMVFRQRRYSAFEYGWFSENTGDGGTRVVRQKTKPMGIV